MAKTTTAMSLVHWRAQASRVLLVDVDPEGSATWWAKRAGRRLPFDFASDMDPSHLARSRELPYDVVFGHTRVAEGPRRAGRRAGASDFVILPTEPAALAVMSLMRSPWDVVVPPGVPYRVLLNIVDPRSPSELGDARALLGAQYVAAFGNTGDRSGK